MAAPNHRWLRFSLRTMFVVLAVATVPMGWLGWNLHSIRQRHALLARHVAPQTRWPEGVNTLRIRQRKLFCTIAPTSTNVGYGLRILGEPNVGEVKLFIRRDKSGAIDSVRRDEIELAARLFPEANILVHVQR
jgi:hypothetical protein